MKNRFLVSAALALALGSGQLLAESEYSNKEMIQAQCDALTAELKPVQEQLPIQLDYMTQLTGFSTMKLASSCLVNINYVFDEDMFVDEMVKGAEGRWTEAQAIDFAQSEQGRTILKGLFRGMAEEGFGDAKAMFPELTININVLSNGANLKPLKLGL